MTTVLFRRGEEARRAPSERIQDIEPLSKLHVKTTPASGTCGNLWYLRCAWGSCNSPLTQQILFKHMLLSAGIPTAVSPPHKWNYNIILHHT